MLPKPYDKLMAHLKEQGYIEDASKKDPILKSCDVSRLPPDLVFIVGNEKIRIPAAYYVSDIGGDCHIMIYKANGWYIGVPFFRHHRIKGIINNGNEATVTIIPSDNPPLIEPLKEPKIVAKIDQHTDVCF